MIALQAKGLSKRFGELTVLQAIDCQLAAGASAAILGRSGSGKSTLLACLAGLESPSAGSVVLLGEELAGRDEDALAALRLAHCGFVFQSFRLLPQLSALDNVRLPLDLCGVADPADRAREQLIGLGLGDRLDHRPALLSGGEQQRVAIARALVTRPAVVFADEPTGNLDAVTAAAVAEALFAAVAGQDAALLLVTHDQDLAARCDAIWRLQEGGLRMAAA